MAEFSLTEMTLLKYFVMSKMRESLMAPPDMQVPADLGVMDRFNSLCWLMNLTRFLMSSESFGAKTSLGLIIKMEASLEKVFKVSSSSKTSPLKNCWI